MAVKFNGNGRHHDHRGQSIYGDHIAFNRVQRVLGQILEKRQSQLTANAPMLARANWLESGGEDDLDPRRSIWDECGYPNTRTLTPQRWQVLYDRDAIAAAVIESMVRCAWQVQPWVYEGKRGKIVTPFERGWAELGDQLRSGGMPDHFGEDQGSPIMEVLERANALSGVGRFGVIVYGLDDGLPWSAPVAGFEESGSKPGEHQVDKQTGEPLLNEHGQVVLNVDRGNERRWSLTINAEMTQGRKLGYMNAFTESMVRINRWETNKQSPRFGQPVTYQITFQDPRSPINGVGIPMQTEQVHWTRVQHVADTVHTYGSSTVLAVPRCQPVLNNIMALQKIYHGGAEGYWKAVFSYLFLETHPQLGGDVDIDDDALRDMMEEMMNGLQRYGLTSGMSAKSVAPSVADPTSHLNSHLEAICIKKRMPMRIFKGSERGELASSQDDSAWNDEVKHYENSYITPAIIRQCGNRLVSFGVLPPPQKPKGLKVEWPDITSMSAQEKAQVVSTRAQAMSTYVNGGLDHIMTVFDFYVDELGYTEEKAKALIDNAMGLADDTYSGDEETQAVPDVIEDWTPPDEGGDGEQDQGGGQEWSGGLEQPPTGNASFFSDCLRDEGGRCKEGTEGIHESLQKWFDFDTASAIKAASAGEDLSSFKTSGGETLSDAEKAEYADSAKKIQATAEQSNSGHTKLWRGQALTPEEMKGLKVGGDYEFKSLTASALDKNISKIYADKEQFLGGEPGYNVLFSIADPKGITGLEIPAGSEHPGGEVILPKGAKYKVASIKKDPEGFTVVSLTNPAAQSPSPAPSQESAALPNRTERAIVKESLTQGNNPEKIARSLYKKHRINLSADQVKQFLDSQKPTGNVTNCGGEGGKPGPCPTDSNSGDDEPAQPKMSPHGAKLKGIYDGFASKSSKELEDEVRSHLSSLKGPEVLQAVKELGISSVKSKMDAIDRVVRKVLDRKENQIRTSFRGGE